MRLIDADALYEKTAEWEARALSVIEKLNRKPFEEMDSNEITEWRKWSWILNERSAFKHDVADAPTVEPQQWIPVSSGKLPEDLQAVNVTRVNHRPVSYYGEIKDKPFNGSAVYYRDKWYWYSQYCVDTLKEYGYCECDEMDDAIEVIAWMPLPKPFKKGEEDE